MKLLAYTIAGQKIGIDIETWNDAMLSGNTAFMAIADTGSTPTDYVDISSIVYWDQFGAITTLTEVEIRQEITKLITLTPTPEEITILEEWGILIDTTIISGETGTFYGNFRVEGKLWVETIRRVKQEANIAYVRVDQDSGVSGGDNIAGLGILNPTGATTGYTNVDEIPVYYLGIDNDGVLVAGWSGDTQPVMRGSASGRLQLVDSVGGQDLDPIAATPLTWGQEDFKDSSVFAFSGNSNIKVLKAGMYELSFSVNGDGAAGRVIPGIQFRKNGTIILPTLSSDYARNIPNDDVNMSIPPYLISLDANDVLDVVTFRLGDSGTVVTKVGASFVRVTYLG